MASEPQRQPLPFEPKRSDKSKPQKPSVAEKISAASAQSQSGKRGSAAAAESIPKVVSNRMVRRMLVFSGIPTALAIVVFVVSYWLLTRQVVEFPKAVVLVITLACFGLGALGLSYGVLSASWEEEVEGSLLGFSEFSVNFRRLIQGLRSSKQTSKSD